MADATAITVQEITEPFEAVTAGSADYTMTACDNTNGNTFVCTGREVLLVYNPSGGALTLTITSTNDETGRTEDITTYSVGAGEFAVFGVGLTNVKGWKNTSGLITITGSTADLDVAVLRIPAGFGH